MTSVKVAKQLLRKNVKLKIAQLSAAEKLRQSEVVTKKLLESPQWNASKKISLFLSMNDEICTEEILRSALLSNKECFIPRYVGSNMDMLRVYSWQDYESLPETSWKIKQPPNDDLSRECAIESGGLDLILVPGLAFSVSGQRLGRGKGYYDSFLSRYHAAVNRPTTTIALAFREQIYDEIPTSEHDMSLDLVLFDNVSA